MADTAQLPFDMSTPDDDAPVTRPDPWAEVRAFLLAHAELVRGDAGLLRGLGLKAEAANVVEFGPAALSRLTEARERESSAREEVEALARANFAAQTEAHAAVLHLLAARNNADLARRIDEAARERFGLLAGTVCLEGFNAPAGWRGLRMGMVSLLLSDAPARLGLAVAKEELFGEAASRVRSMALVRLELFEPMRPGLLAFASTEPDGFTPDMGAELVAFLARVVERTAERWPLT